MICCCKDSVCVCIINENGIVFQEKYGVLTPELEQMLEKMMEYHVEEVVRLISERSLCFQI